MNFTSVFKLPSGLVRDRSIRYFDSFNKTNEWSLQIRINNRFGTVRNLYMLQSVCDMIAESPNDADQEPRDRLKVMDSLPAIILEQFAKYHAKMMKTYVQSLRQCKRTDEVIIARPDASVLIDHRATHVEIARMRVDSILHRPNYHLADIRSNVI